jgi:glycosyltransferase involved in cell wall biosynthesis
MDKPLKLAICSWCYGIGGGAARMEAYYHRFYNRELIEPHIIGLVSRPSSGPEYDSSLPFIQLDQSRRFEHLVALLQNFDVIQFQGSFDPLVCEASKFVKRPHVLLEVLHNIEQGGMYEEIDGIIGVSEAVRKVQLPDRNYRTILNGIDLDLFPFSDKEKSNDKIILLQVARRSKMAINLDELAEDLAAIHPAIELWIAGDWIGQSTERVKFLGIRQDIADLYRLAHFTVLLSKEEPFGLAAVESMAVGTPVILSNSGGFVDIVSDPSQGFLVDGPDRQQALAAISQAIACVGTDKYRQIVDAGRKRVEERFGIRHCVTQYEDFILELYAAKGNSSPEIPGPLKVPAAALVGEALYDLHANDLPMMATRLKALSCSDEALRPERILIQAHQLGAYLKRHRPDLLPRELGLYLYCCGDRIEDTLEGMIDDLDLVREKGLYEHFYNYLCQTKDQFPQRWKRLNAV